MVATDGYMEDEYMDKLLGPSGLPSLFSRKSLYGVIYNADAILRRWTSDENLVYAACSHAYEAAEGRLYLGWHFCRPCDSPFGLPWWQRPRSAPGSTQRRCPRGERPKYVARRNASARYPYKIVGCETY